MSFVYGNTYSLNSVWRAGSTLARQTLVASVGHLNIRANDLRAATVRNNYLLHVKPILATIGFIIVSHESRNGEGVDEPKIYKPFCRQCEQFTLDEPRIECADVNIDLKRFCLIRDFRSVLYTKPPPRKVPKNAVKNC